MTMYFVLNGHTLGFVWERNTSVFHPLAATVDGRDWKNGPFHLVKTDALRVATLDDFNRFRVDPKGHIA